MGVVYALFSAGEGSEAATRELTRRCPEHRAFAVQTHTRSPLDADHLPDAATEFGRQVLFASLVGAGLGLVLGAGVSAFVDIPGMGTFSMAGFGGFFGVAVAWLSAVMMGNRSPRPVLRELAGRLGDGAVLMIVDVDGGEADVVEGILEANGGRELGRL